MEAEIINLAERILWNVNPKAALVTTGMYSKLDCPEMEQIKKDLEDIHWLLSQPSAGADYYTYWLEELKKILYEVDDLFDEISTDGLQQQAMIMTRSTPTGQRISKEVSRLFFSTSLSSSSSSSSSLSSYARSSYSRVIKRTGERLHDVLAQLLRVNIDRDGDRGDLKEPEPQPEGSISSGPENFVVKDYKGEIKRHLLGNKDTENNVSVVAILGNPGVGKTTLARDIFNDDEIDKNFDLKAWVQVSKNFDVDYIIIQILASTGNEYDLFSLFREDSSILDLGNELSGRIYLIVLDDVHISFMNEWKRLKYYFNRGRVGSRILVTTGDDQVANVMEAFPYHLKGLEKEDAMKLFEPTTLSKHFKEEIVRKWSGEPLAIPMIAAMLHDQKINQQKAWTDEDLKRILDSQDVNHVIQELKKMSYNNLAPPLKVCFTYCVLFPKDIIIDVEKLIHLWTAQGFIIPSSDGRKSLEDLGMEYFKELLRRSFIEEVGGKDEFGNFKCCKISNLMHDMANEKAGEGIAVLDTNKNDEKSLKEPRHLCFKYDMNSSKNIYGTRLGCKKKLRSFLAYEKYNHKSSLVGTRKGSIHEFNLSQFKRLRVCDVHNFGIDKVSRSIRELKYLRYLDFSGNEKLQWLPNCITELQNLQVLKLSNCEKLKWLPKDISKLVNLRHLDCHGCWELRYMPRGLGQLTSLQTLTWFVVAPKEVSSSSRASSHGHAGGLNELSSLNELRGKLTILNLKDLRYGRKELHQQASVLKEKQHLQSLTLDWGRIDEDDWKEEITEFDDDYWLQRYLEPHESLKALKVSGYGGRGIPSWLTTLKELVSFTVSRCQRVQRLPAFNPKAALQYLRIEGMENLQFIETGESSSFLPDLKELKIHKCPVLERWLYDKERSLFFPGLFTLEIMDCPKLTSVPPFPYLEGNLVLKSTSAAVLLQTLKMKMTGVPSSSSFRPLCKLQGLRIEGMQEDLTNLLDLGVHNLTSLHSLHIYDCPNLESLPKTMSKTSLRELCIRNCRKLKVKYEDKKSEEWLKIKHIPNIKIGLRQVQLDSRYLLDSRN